MATVTSKVPMTAELKALLQPDLFKKEPIFVNPLLPPQEGEKVYELSEEEVNKIKQMRGAVVDLHPGMGGIAPDKIIQLVNEGARLTSLDFMITRGCNFECTWCFAEASPRQKDYLPFHLLKSITEEASDLGVKLFVLTGGEPLVYRDPELDSIGGVGNHFFEIIRMIRDIYKKKDRTAKILAFDDVALITPEIAKKFAEYEIGLCTKGDTLSSELQDYKVNQVGAYKKMQRGYQNLVEAGYGKDPRLRVVVNSILDHTTFDGMVDLHLWVMDHGFDHSIVPIHYCGNAEDEDQEAGVHSPHVKVLYDVLSRIDKRLYDIEWTPWSAFPYNKTCNRNRSGLHIRANGNVAACSESPGMEATSRYTFGNIFDKDFSLTELVESEKLSKYRKDFAQGYGTYVCSPEVCDLHKNDLCLGGCAVRSAYSKVNHNSGLIVKNKDPHNFSQYREDPLCPAWTELALQQGILKEGLMESIHNRLLDKSRCLNLEDFPFLPRA